MTFSTKDWLDTYLLKKDNSDSADVIFATMCSMPSPTVCAHPISVMGLVMGNLYCFYEPHSEMGVADTDGA